VNYIDRMRNVIQCLNEARRRRDALRDRQCELRSGLSQDTVSALRMAGLTRVELCQGGIEMTADRAVALAAVDREVQRVDAEIQALEVRLHRLGHELEKATKAPAAEPAGPPASSGMVIPFPRRAARRTATSGMAGTASVA
jgi:hypothetical protein